MTHESLVKTVEYVCQKVYNKNVKIENISHPKWSSDENYECAYTNTPVLNHGESGKDFYSSLCSPLNNETFHFAGEAFDYLNGGFMQGAYYSGKRAAEKLLENKILQRP